MSPFWLPARSKFDASDYEHSSNKTEKVFYVVPRTLVLFEYRSARDIGWKKWEEKAPCGKLFLFSAAVRTKFMHKISSFFVVIFINKFLNRKTALNENKVINPVKFEFNETHQGKTFLLGLLSHVLKNSLWNVQLALKCFCFPNEVFIRTRIIWPLASPEFMKLAWSWYKGNLETALKIK